jgi:hypothetical protein
MRVCDVSVTVNGHSVTTCYLKDGETPEDLVELSDKELLGRIDISCALENLDEDDIEVDDITLKEYEI